jgi:hypothetical protein
MTRNLRLLPRPNVEAFTERIAWREHDERAILGVSPCRICWIEMNAAIQRQHECVTMAVVAKPI